MDIDGVPAAAWYGFRYRGVDSFYQSGRSARWDDASLGLLMQARAIRSSIDDGIDQYRFLRGGESYKARFANGDRPLMTLVVGRTSLGRAAAAIGEAAVRSPSLRRIGARVFDTGGRK
jgi:CelD/BcsL family acetyltransferase involved in cellulose biosynthesis